MIITCIGGVDVGKSCLISRILINTEAISNREINKAIKESKQWLSNLIDTDDDEKDKGITIHSTLEKFIIEGKEYNIVNNPGHKNLTNEMIKNSSIADIALLVISAKPNELKNSINQGYEHSLITRVNGIKSMIVCINKSEFLNSTDNTYEKIVNHAKKAYKEHRYEKMIFIPISAKLNLNISKNDSNLVNYCLFDIFKNIEIHKRKSRSIKPIDNIVNAKLFFHKIPKIITIGFKCILHSLDKVYHIEFINIQNDKDRYITKLNSKNKFISCDLRINTNDHLDDSILLRDQNETVAYGILF